MRQVIFLDFDDVICLNDPYGGYDVIDAALGKPSPQDLWQRLFALAPRQALRKLFEGLQPAPLFVISSSWRYVMSRRLVEAVLRNTGLAFVADALHADWQTPHCPDSMTRRAWEIAEWLKAHPEEPFIVLDDQHSGPGSSQYIMVQGRPGSAL